MLSKIIDLEEWRKYGTILVPCLLGMMLIAVHVYTLGVMLGPIEEEFGWSRSEISAGPFLTSIAILFLAPFGGRAVDRFGARRIALIGVPLFSIAIAMISLANSNLFSWLGLYVLLAAALVFIYPTVWTAAIALRFVRNRGLALAICLSGTGLTSAVIPFIASRLLGEFGWRGAYIGLGILAFVLVYPVVIFLFDKDGKDIAKEIAKKEAQENPEGIASDRPREMFTSKFFLLTAAAFVYSVSVTMLAVNAVPILIEDGFGLLRAAELAGLIGIGTICGRMLGGLLLDRMDGRYVAILSGLGALAAVSILLGFEQSALAASIACFSLGLAGGAEFDACAYLATRHFDRRNFGALFGIISGLTGFGSGIAPIAANAVFDISGSYQPVLWGMIPALGIASLLFMSIGPYPDEAQGAD